MIKLLLFPFKFPQFLSKLFSPFRTIAHLPSTCNRGISVRPAMHFSRFGFHKCFSRNTQWNTKHSLYTFLISCKFRVLLMSQKNKQQNPLGFRTNANPGKIAVKCKQRKKGRKRRKKWHKIPRYTLFVFCILRPFLRISQ